MQTCCRPAISSISIQKSLISPRRISSSVKYLRQNSIRTRVCGVRASMVESFDSSIKRMERAWLISQQPRPVSCSSCDSNGHVDCKWCGGTGFFIIGDNMLCQVPSRNTNCVICAGKGSTCCSDCKGTGFRAKWLEEPPIPKRQICLWRPSMHSTMPTQKQLKLCPVVFLFFIPKLANYILLHIFISVTNTLHRAYDSEYQIQYGWASLLFGGGFTVLRLVVLRTKYNMGSRLVPLFVRWPLSDDLISRQKCIQ